MATRAKYGTTAKAILLLALLFLLVPGSGVRAQDTSGVLYCYYAHTSSHPDWIKPGVQVKQGDLIGYSGETGYLTGPHLHLGCSPLPPDELQNQLNGPWPWVDPHWELHAGWTPPLKNPYEIGAAYYAANPAGAQAHHTGVDYRASVGTPLYAVADGTIVWTAWWPTWSEASGAGHGLTIVLRIDPGQPTTGLSAGQVHTVTVATGWSATGLVLLFPIVLLVLRRKNPGAYKRTIVGLQKTGEFAWTVVLLADQFTFGFTRPDRVRMTKAVLFGVWTAFCMACLVISATILPVLSDKGVPVDQVVAKADQLSPMLDNFLQFNVDSEGLPVYQSSFTMPANVSGITYVGVYGALNGWGTLGQATDAVGAIQKAMAYAQAAQSWSNGKIVPVVNIRVTDDTVMNSLIGLCSGRCIVMIDVTPNQDLTGYIQTYAPKGDNVWFDVDLEHRGVPTSASEFNGWAKQYFDIRQSKGFTSLGVFAFYDFRSDPWLTPSQDVVWNYGDNGLVVPIFDGHCSGTSCADAKYGATRTVLGNYAGAKAVGIMEFVTRWGCGSSYGDCGFTPQQYFDQFKPLIFMSQ